MSKRSRITKAKNRNFFAVRSLISNRKRFVNFVSKSATTPNTNLASEPSSSVPELLEPILREDKTPQSWKNRRIKCSEEWSNISEKLRQTWLDQEGAIDGTFCCECLQAIANVRCRDCGPDQFFCENCAATFHSKRCCFHRLEKWEVSLNYFTSGFWQLKIYREIQLPLYTY